MKPLPAFPVAAGIYNALYTVEHLQPRPVRFIPLADQFVRELRVTRALFGDSRQVLLPFRQAGPVHLAQAIHRVLCRIGGLGKTMKLTEIVFFVEKVKLRLNAGLLAVGVVNEVLVAQPQEPRVVAVTLRRFFTFAPHPIVTKVLVGQFTMCAGNNRAGVSHQVDDVKLLIAVENMTQLLDVIWLFGHIEFA